ncbi:DUF6042 family protein [Actinoplanes sp. OR16]|uniref:DUF6042 family protein n=1 Tax=Actinoplanes sp. OR16 TaxID=946334 RepID=UPI000FD6F5E3|nr:DUF6042 family protein [Actinoplanes sp. OR16]
MRVFESDDYRPESGLLVLRDPGIAGDSPRALPHSYDRSDEPAGTFAGSGAGWLACHSLDGRLRVRISSHDQRPRDVSDISDLSEIPYLSFSGSVVVAGGPVLDLGGGGSFRVRVGRSADRLVVQFWPVPDIEPPVWLRRGRPATGTGNSGWLSELGYAVMELAGVVGEAAGAHGGPVTTDQVAAWGHEHQRPDGWLDTPVWPLPRTPLPTGHADLDQRNAAQHADAARRAENRQRRLDEIAAELGVPPVLLRRDSLPLLAAAGILVRDGTDRYRPGEPARVDTVLALPPERARMVRAQDAHHRYGRLAEDLEAVLRWSAAMPYEVTVAALAARLLVEPADVRAGLTFAEDSGLLHIVADESDRLRLMLGRRASPPSSKPAQRGARPAGKATMRAMRFTPRPAPLRRQSRSAIPFGPPPRAGMLFSDGTLTNGSDGVPMANVRLEAAAWTRAMQTARGILMAGPNRVAQLISSTAEMTFIDDVRSPDLLLMSDGKRVVVSENDQNRLRVVDLDGGPTVTMPWPADRPLSVVGTHGHTVYFTGGHGSTMSWTPGGEPREAAHPFQQIDPLTGTGLTRTRQGITVIRPDHAEITVPVDLTARLTLGGDRLWTARANPPAVTVFPLRPNPKPQVHWLPEGSYREPIWEDRDHILLGCQPWHSPREPSAGIRLSLRTGAVERLPAAIRPMLFVEPFPRP